MNDHNMKRTAAALGVVVVAVAALHGCGGGGDGGNRGILSFTSLSFSVNENGLELAPVVVQRLGGSGAVSATLVFEGGTADAVLDFDATPIVITWDAGDVANKTIIIPVVNDHLDEMEESIQLRLTNPTGGATIRDPLGDATLNVVDDDNAGAIQFLTPVFFFGEDGTPLGLEVTVIRFGGDDGPVTAELATADGTATSDPFSAVEPLDYTPVAAIVSFADQDAAPVTVSLAGAIVQDLLPELDETFSLVLSNPTGAATIGSAGMATVTIFDDDPILEIPSPGGGTLFGAALAKQGRHLLIGAPGHAAPSGRVFVADPATGAIVDTLSRPFSTQFGTSLLVDGGAVAIGGAGNVWVVDAATGVDLFLASSTLQGFGRTLTGLGDGRLVVGAPDALVSGGVTPSGALRVYDFATGSLLQGIDGTGDGELGAALAAFGGELVAGAPGSDGAAFRYAGAPLALALTIANPSVQSPGTRFGAALAADAGAVYVGAPDEDAGGSTDRGRVYAFSAGGVASVAGPGASARYGSALLRIADRLCVFAPGGGPLGAGQVDVLDQSLAFSYGAIDDPSPSPDAGFGAAMIEYDGVLVIGAPRQDVAAGPDGGSVFLIRLN